MKRRDDRVKVKQDESDVPGLPPGSAASWTGFSDFISGDGALSVIEQVVFFGGGVPP